MKKSLAAILVLASVGALVIFAAADRQVTRAQPDSGPRALPDVSNQAAPTRVWQCFDVERGDDEKAIVRLVTENFGGDRVRVRQLVMMCELAFKVPPGATDTLPPTDAETFILACYRLELGADPNDLFVLDTDNFGEDGVVVRTSVLMCETASKTRTLNAPGGPVSETVGHSTGQTWQCYKLTQGDNPQQGFLLVTNNFGRDAVRVLDGVLMCEDSAKFKQDASGGPVVQFGEATGQVMECFRLAEGLNPGKQVTLDTLNFGADNVVVQRSTMMCESAEKTPVYIAGVAFPDDDGP